MDLLASSFARGSEFDSMVRAVTMLLEKGERVLASNI